MLNKLFTSHEELIKYFLISLNLKENNLLLDDLIKNQLLTNDFEKKYIINNSTKEINLISKEILKDNEVAYYFESKKEKLPYKIHLVKKDNWKIKSFKFQCISCFGADDKCGVCGGSGWGVL